MKFKNVRIGQTFRIVTETIRRHELKAVEHREETHSEWRLVPTGRTSEEVRSGDARVYRKLAATRCVDISSGADAILSVNDEVELVYG